VFIRTQTNGDRTHLLLVENERMNGRLVQRVLYRLGRLDELRASASSMDSSKVSAAFPRRGHRLPGAAR
jgi:hypothetical protein